MTKKRITILDKAAKHIEDKIATLEEQIAALRLALKHLHEEQEAATPQRRQLDATLTDTTAR